MGTCNAKFKLFPDSTLVLAKKDKYSFAKIKCIARIFHEFPDVIEYLREHQSFDPKKKQKILIDTVVYDVEKILDDKIVCYNGIEYVEILNMKFFPEGIPYIVYIYLPYLNDSFSKVYVKVEADEIILKQC